MKRYLGTVNRKPLLLNPAALLSTHTLVDASSGGGKSWLLRRLLEQTFGLFPHLVIDPEGELRTLREKYDYIIASADSDGDCLAHPRTAKMLAIKLLELNASCIIDIYELSTEQQVLFVRDFTAALVAAPKKLWGPRLVVLDEGQLWAPEKQGAGQASRRQVVDLLSRGRKRGYGVVLATQRIAKLSKDAMSECRNKVYGFSNYLADRKRKTEDLGFIKREEQALFAALDVGQFYVTGPAFSREVELMTVAKVSTTHPDPGEGIVVHTPPPRAKVQKQLAALVDLPKQAKAEAETLAQAKAEIKELRREMKQTTKAPDEATLGQARDAGIKEGWAAGEKQAAAEVKALRGQVRKAAETMRKVGVTLAGAAGDLAGSPVLEPAKPEPTRQSIRTPVLPKPKTFPDPLPARVAIPDPVHLPQLKAGARRMAQVLVNCYPMKLTRSQLATMSKMKKTGGSFTTYLSALRMAVYLIEIGDGRYQASDTARERWGKDAIELNTNEDVVEMWISVMPRPKAGVIIRLLRDAHPEGYERADLAHELGLNATGGSFGSYLSMVTSNGLSVNEGGVYIASEELLREP